MCVCVCVYRVNLGGGDDVRASERFTYLSTICRSFHLSIYMSVYS